MDEHRLAAIRDMAPGSVRYLPASFEKRFARGVAARAEDPAFEPTPRQWVQIQRLAHRYRRQAPVAHSVLCEACGPEKMAPLFGTMT